MKYMYRDCTVYEAKTKALISCTVTEQLTCASDFTYAKSRFSHAAHFKLYFTLSCFCQVQLSLVVRKRSSGLLTWSDTNRAVQQQKMARGLKFWI